MDTLNKVEKKILNFLVKGDDFRSTVLQKQLLNIIKVTRRDTDVGFFTYFEIDPSVEVLNGEDFRLDDIFIRVKGLKNGAGAILFVKNGKIDFLEVYTFDELWPDNVNDVELSRLSDLKNSQ